MEHQEIKSILAKIQQDPEAAHGEQDELDELITKIIDVERKHLHQIQAPSRAKRLRDVRELIESELRKILGNEK